MNANFFIAGFPKCGTTSLYSWLSQHPQVFLSAIKEPHFFSKDLGIGRVPTQSRYDALFSDIKGHHKVAGEASTNYLYSDCAVDNIIQYNPSAKFIVCLRNPVDFLPSLYRQLRNHLAEPELEFSRAWELRGRNSGMERVGFLTEDGLVNYRSAARLGYYSERLLSKVGKEQVMFVVLDEMRCSPDSVFRSLARFLCIDDNVSIDFAAKNEAVELRIPLIVQLQLIAGKLKRYIGIDMNFGIFRFFSKRNYSPVSTSPIDDLLISEIRDMYSKDIELLSSVTGYDFSMWDY